MSDRDSASSEKVRVRESARYSRKRDASRIRPRAVGISPRSPISESRVREQLVPAPRAHVTSTSGRRVVLSCEIPGSTRGQGPRPKIKGGREARCESRARCAREFSRPSTVSKRAADRLSSRFTRHPLTTSVPYTSVATYTVHHTRAETSGARRAESGERRADGESHVTHTHATPTHRSWTNTLESRLVIISSPAIARWEKRTAAAASWKRR